MATLPASVGNYSESASPTVPKKHPLIIGDYSLLMTISNHQTMSKRPHFKGFMEGGKGDVEFIDIGCIRPSFGLLMGYTDRLPMPPH